MPKRKNRFSFAQISRLTATEDDAIGFAEHLRWPEGVTCHRCESRDVARLGGRPGRYRCRACDRQFSIRTGTPMESSRLPISTWLRGLWLILTSSKGISSLKLAEMLGIQQRSAWFLAHRVREMMAWVVRKPLSGEIVEVDEVYAGAKPRKKAGGGPTGVKSGRGPRRPLVFTAAVRGGEARFTRIASHGTGDFANAIDQLVETAGTFMTDSLPGYDFLKENHRSVTHSKKEFARTDPDGTDVHVNTAESCHADLRRMVIGVHHWISRQHLDRYLEDLAFRRSLRDADVLERLRAALTSPGRLTYRDLIAQP